MARPARFERATAWFVARYSIQLSYGRVFLSEAGLSRCCRYVSINGGERGRSRAPALPALRDIRTSMYSRILTIYRTIEGSNTSSINFEKGLKKPLFKVKWRRERSFRTSLCSHDTCTSMCIGILTLSNHRGFE